MRRYLLLSGLLFGLISLIQLVRAVVGVPIVVYGVDIPRWPSGLAFLITGSLAVWAFRLRKLTLRS
jgi:hypothetical protein